MKRTSSNLILSESDLQQKWLKLLPINSALGYQIHPDIIKTLPTASPRIADIGTGSGDYLIRLSKTLPDDARLDGFDISPGCFCAEDERPANVNLLIHDVRLPFPAEYHAQFDFIHVRLIVLGLNNDDWPAATQNLTQLLKPGGALQWEESYTSKMSCVRGKPGTKCENLESLLNKVLDVDRVKFMTDGTSILPGLFEKAGLTSVFQDVVSSDRVLEGRENYSTMLIEGAKIYLTAMGKTSEAWLEYMMQKAHEDVRNGAYWRIDIYATIGVKAV